MNKEIPIEKEPIFSRDKIEPLVKPLGLNPQDVDKLAKGEKTRLLEAIPLEDGRVVTGKVYLTKDEQGKPKVNVLERQNELDIKPDIIKGHTLNKDEMEALQEGSTVGPLTKDKLFLKVDKDLNAVSVSTQGNIGLKDEIAGYKLSKEDKQLLANGKPMPTRMFKSKGRYFTGVLSMTDGNKGLMMSGVTEVPKKDVERVSEALNGKVNIHKDVQLKGAEKEANKSKESDKTKSKEKLQAHEYKKKVIDSLEKNDLKSVSNLMTRKNELVSSKEIDKLSNLSDEIKTSPNISKESKIGYLTMEGKSSKELSKTIKPKKDQSVGVGLIKALTKSKGKDQEMSI